MFYRQLGHNLVKGVGFGLFMATGLTAWITLLRATAGPDLFQSASYPATIALYYGGGLVGGCLIGLLLPLRRWSWGYAVLGLVGVFPLYFGAPLTYAGVSEPFTRNNLAVSLPIALLVGGAVGVWAWLDDHPRTTTGIALLRRPTGRIVALTWAVVALIGSASYLGSTRWTGTWPGYLAIWMAFVSFIVPLVVACLVTASWTGRRR